MGVDAVGVRAGVGEAVPVGRSTSEVAALDAGLGAHRGEDAEPGDFDQYWQYHLDRQYQRTHASRYTDQLAPAA